MYGSPLGVYSLQQAASVLLDKVQPHASAAWIQAQRWSDLILQHVSPHAESATAWIDVRLDGLLPWQIAAITALTVLFIVWFLHELIPALADLREAGNHMILPSLFNVRFALFDHSAWRPFVKCTLKVFGTLTGLLQSSFEVVKSLPGVKGIVRREHAKMLVSLLKKSELQEHRGAETDIDVGNSMLH